MTEPRFPADRAIAWRNHAAVAGLSVVALAGLFRLGASPERVEATFTEGFGTALSRIVSGATSALPFSLAELVYIAIAAWIVVAPARAVWQVRRGRRSWRNALGSGLAQVASVGGAALVAFYALWGLNYARAPAVERFGWEPVALDDPHALEELARLSEELVALGNAHYVALHGVGDAGVPTRPPADLDLDATFDVAYRRVATQLSLHPTFAAPRGPVKPLRLTSPIFTWLGISGVYFPFTGEANVNVLPPPWQVPHTVAHEKAHQRGVASEDEANFYGFLACIASDDPYVRYSGWMFAQRRLLSTFVKADPERGQALIARRLPGVQRDVDHANAFWAAWDGWGHVLGSTVNDVYLRSNRVEGGIRSYGLSARLIVGWARQHGGTFGHPNG